jgi:hypothetical protein
MGLIGAQNVELDGIKDWQTSWESAYDALPPGQAPARLHPDRKYYYLRAFEEMLGSDQPGTVLWPTTMANILSENSAAQDNWQQVFEQVGLLGDGFGERIEALDAYLDQVEETLDDWARRQGAL